jgi:hypothetical protein
MFAALRRPLIALILGLAPLVLFAGISNTVTVNGDVVRDDNFNALGILLAIIGLGLAISALRSTGAFATLRKAVAIGALIVCGVQLAASAGLVSPQRLLAFLMPDSDLPSLTYEGLDALNRKIPEGILAKNDPDETRHAIVNYKASLISNARIHMAYADRCHEGRYRIDIKAVEALPDFLTDEDRSEVARRTGDEGKLRPEQCSKDRTKYAMGELVDDIHRMTDFVQVLADGYPAQLAEAKPQ